MTDKGKKQLKKEAQAPKLPIVKKEVSLIKNEVNDQSVTYAVSRVKSWINKQNDILRERLLDKLRKVDPGEFETLMVKLISAVIKAQMV